MAWLPVTPRVAIWGSVASLGLVLVVIGVVLTTAGDDIVAGIIHGKLSLFDRESDGFKYFVTPPTPVHVNFTFFEVKNPEEVLNGAKPHLSERGPYVFIEHREKRNLSWYNPEGSETDQPQLVKFGQYKYYTFLQENSCDQCREDDQVTIANMPLLGLIGKLDRLYKKDQSFSIKAAFQKLVQGFETNFTNKDVTYGFDGLFFTQKVSDFVFHGIKTGTSGWMASGVTFLTDRLPITAFDTENGFALFNHRNDTMENEWYEVETEAMAWDRHTLISKWGQKNKNHPHSADNLMSDLYEARASTIGKTGDRWWGDLADVEGVRNGSNTCNILKGTDGNQFPPFVDKADPLWIFNSAPCRSIFLIYTRDVVVEAIPTLEYSVPKDGANVNNSLNTCACESLSEYMYGSRPHPYNTNTSCVKRREESWHTLDLSQCQAEVTRGCHDGIQDLFYCQGAAISLSYPHFYLAEDQVQHFTGLAPDPEKHALRLNVEPYTGMTLKMHSRIQLNVPLISNASLSLHGIPVLETVKDIPNFPVLWIDLGADIESDPALVEKLYNELVLPTHILEVAKWVSIGLGMALIIIAGFFAILSPIIPTRKGHNVVFRAPSKKLKKDVIYKRFE